MLRLLNLKVHLFGVGLGEGGLGERIAKCTFEKRIRKSDSFVMPVFCQVGAPRFFKPCYYYRTKDSLKKRRLRLDQQRRRVEITDEEPCSHPDKCHYPLFRNFHYTVRASGLFHAPFHIMFLFIAYFCQCLLVFRLQRLQLIPLMW
ncbi:hypothetical protein MKW94_021076 [Papaver nudicaule]|uniref:Uncharacterized protein n=1 Tax=Papaver nudicaule TaxID=74823 RepID=A0AA41VGW9_PAPNU|nr:hypothetical protein [Papaver nudicaule]